MKIYRKYFIVTLSIAVLCVAGNASAQELKKLRKIISDEMYYPRECRYVIPANLPDNTYSKGKNDAFMEIARFLEKNKLVTLKTQGNKTIITPSENTYDIIQQNVNIRYELISISIVLGIWDIEVTGGKMINGATVIEGRRLLSKQSPLYDSFIKILPDSERKEYLPSKMRWEISKRKDKEKSVLESVSDN